MAGKPRPLFQVWTRCRTAIDGDHFSIVASDKTLALAVRGARKSAANIHFHAHGKPLYWTRSDTKGHHLVTETT